MGDLQLVTGFSILISGAVQLDCGLTVYEWQIVVYLAWFSCLTHLSCLMVMRSYLHVHTVGRTWRLVAMGVLAILLIVGLLPTANYGHLYNQRPGPSDYAKCYLKVRRSSGITLCSMILSVLTIAIGFISRVMKLHKMLSVTLWGGLRIRTSHRSRAILRVIYRWSVKSGPAQGLSFSLVYRPLLAVFLAARFLLDAWVSMFVEVCSRVIIGLNIDDLIRIGAVAVHCFFLGCCPSSDCTQRYSQGSRFVDKDHRAERR